MGKLWTIIKREYLERVRTRWFVIATVFGPVFFGSLIIIPAYMARRGKASTEFTNTIILDATSIGMGQKVAKAMSAQQSPGSAAPLVRKVSPSELSQAESTATRQVMRKQATGYLVLDEQTLRGEQLRYAGRNATSLGDMERVRTTVREILLAERLEGAGVKPEKVKELTFMPIRLDAERITDKGRGGSGAVSIIFAGVVAFLLYMSIVLAGKVLGVGAVGLTQQILWVLASIVMFKARAPVFQRLGIAAMPFQMPEIS